jgi:hypothetical protein
VGFFRSSAKSVRKNTIVTFQTMPSQVLEFNYLQHMTPSTSHLNCEI